jgi:hypothetical protein
MMNRTSTVTSKIAARLCAIAFVLLPHTVPAAPAPAVAGTQTPPRLAALHIEIWPEYDRRAVLVILKAELPREVALPTALSLRIPASSGGPSAVAYATNTEGQLFNLPHERVRDGEFITLRLQAPERHVHVEFYEPLATAAPDRDYTYLWPGDLAVSRMGVSLQQPAGATDLSVQPTLDAAGTGRDGLSYRASELGAFAAGSPLPIRIQYTKTDLRTSLEILGKKAPTSSGAASGGWRTLFPAWEVMLAFAVALLAAGSAAWLWLHRRRRYAAGRSCVRCQAALAAGSRYCPNCGAPADGRE